MNKLALRAGLAATSAVGLAVIGMGGVASAATISVHTSGPNSSVTVRDSDRNWHGSNGSWSNDEDSSDSDWSSDDASSNDSEWDNADMSDHDNWNNDDEDMQQGNWRHTCAKSWNNCVRRMRRACN